MEGLAMDREEFDRLFDQAFEEAARDSELVPDPENSWVRFEKRLANRARRRRRLRLVPYIVLSFMLGAFVFGTPAVTIAFQPIIESATSIRDGVVELTVGRQKLSDTIPKTDAPPGHIETPDEGQDVENSGMSRYRHEKLSEAVKNLAFKPPAIHHVDDSFELAEFLTFRPHDADKDEQLWIKYNRKTGGEGHYTISLKVFHPGTLMRITSEQRSVETETIIVNGYEAYLQVANEGYAQLQFFVDDLHVSILGLLKRDEIMMIAEGLRFPR
jgi:hypothetical protein